MARADLTCDRLREALSYDPTTGQFVRRTTGQRAGWASGSGYTYINLDGRKYSAHRLAWMYVYGDWPKNVIDHINGVRTDNRVANLRDIPQSENVRTKRVCKGSSGIVGVHYRKRDQRWIAKASLAPLTPAVHLGSFRTKEEAIVARKMAVASYGKPSTGSYTLDLFETPHRAQA